MEGTSSGNLPRPSQLHFDTVKHSCACELIALSCPTLVLPIGQRWAISRFQSSLSVYCLLLALAVRCQFYLLYNSRISIIRSTCTVLYTVWLMYPSAGAVSSAGTVSYPLVYIFSVPAIKRQILEHPERYRNYAGIVRLIFQLPVKLLLLRFFLCGTYGV